MLNNAKLLLKSNFKKLITTKTYNYYLKNINDLTLNANIDQKTILFSNYQYDFSDNHKYIALKLHGKRPDLKIIFVISSNISNKINIPNWVKIVKRNSLEHFKAMFTAKIWIDNAFSTIMDIPFAKKESQYVIQTWHASSGFKQIGKRKNLVEFSRNEVDYVLSSSKIDTDRFKIVWPNANIVNTGHPRNDILFSATDYHTIICQFYNINKDSKLCLYAPTNRANNKSDYFITDFTKLLNVLNKKFQGNWVILNRMHHKNKSLIIKNQKNIIDATSYPDMQKLIAGTNIGISDYSSWMPCMLMMKKPMFIFASDYIRYKEKRGFMHDLQLTPMPFSTNLDALYNNISQFNITKYEKTVKKYLRKYKFFDNGNSSTNTVNLIEKLLKK